MQFDLILTNPPFQNSEQRGKTHHKLWVDFTTHLFSNSLAVGGSLIQVSPASFASPSNPVLEIMKANSTRVVRFGTESYFPDVASTFSDYWIVKSENHDCVTRVVDPTQDFEISLDPSIYYLPNNLGPHSMAIHRKVMFDSIEKLNVEWDYVTCHNVLRNRKPEVLNETETVTHKFPVFHTNKSTWYASVRQEWADQLKVMWTRSGYTKPFFDPGVLGGTDMVYFVTVESESQGMALAHNLNSRLFRYIFKTAKWSGFGHERVFRLLPDMSKYSPLNDDQLFAQFGLTPEEVEHVANTMG